MPTRRYEINLVVQTQQNQAQQQLNAVAASVQNLNRQFAATTAGILTIKSAFDTVTGAAQAYREKLKELDEQSKQLALGGLSKQERLGEYGYLLGVPNNQALRQKVDAFGSKTGLNEQSQINFLTRFESSGGQYKGKGPGSTMSPEQYERYQTLVAKRAAQMHIDPGIVADLGAGILGNTDWNEQAAKDPKGHSAATLAFTQFEQILKELAVGKGENKRLLEDFLKVFTMEIKRNREEGVLKGDDAPQRLAAMISAVAEVVPKEAGTYTLRAFEGVRMIDKKKAAPWFKKAGIDLDVQPDVAMRTMSEYYDAHPEIHRKGEVIDDFLRSRVGLEFRRSTGMGAIISGMKKGIVSHRLAVARQVTPENAEANLENDMKDNVTMAAQVADRQVEEAKNRQGDPDQRLKVLRSKTESILREAKKFGVAGDPRWRGIEGALRWAYNSTAGNYFGKIDDAAEIDAELIKILSQTGERMGTTHNSMGITDLSDVDWRKKTIKRLSPMSENKTGRSVEDLLDQILQAIKEQKEQHAAGVPNNAQAGKMVPP